MSIPTSAGRTRSEQLHRGERAGARRRAQASKAAIRRRRAVTVALLLVVAGILLVQLGSGSGSSGTRSKNPGTLQVVFGGHTIARVPVSSLQHRAALSGLLGRIPAQLVQQTSRVEISWHLDRRALDSRLRNAVEAGQATVMVPRHAMASSIDLPVVRQILHNNCETAALAMVMRGAGKRVDQLVLQRQLRRSPPLDPQASGSGAEIWGDPNQGFVGRADGGGPGGGYGVYQRPIAALARHHGVQLRDLTGRGVEAVYRTLLSGSPVMAWVALSDGPFATWRTLGGRVIHANYGEHAVVLTAVRGNSVRINDPLSGQVLWWSKSTFASRWEALGRRALADTLSARR